MERYYDAHLYLADWGARHLMLRIPRDVCDLATAAQYGVDGYADFQTTADHLVIALASEDAEGEEDWEDPEELLAEIVGVRAELAAGDLRPLYLAWLAAYGTWERDEDAFTEDAEDELEPRVPAGLTTLTPAQRALARFLRIDLGLLDVAAGASPELTDTAELASWIGGLPDQEKNALLLRSAQGQAALVGSELARGYRSGAAHPHGGRPRRTVAKLLDTAAEVRSR